MLGKPRYSVFNHLRYIFPICCDDGLFFKTVMEVNMLRFYNGILQIIVVTVLQTGSQLSDYSVNSLIPESIL